MPYYNWLMKYFYFSGSRDHVTTKIYVGNLPESCSKNDLLSLFEQFGKVAEADIVKNYAFVVSMQADHRATNCL